MERFISVEVRLPMLLMTHTPKPLAITAKRRRLDAACRWAAAAGCLVLGACGGTAQPTQDGGPGLPPLNANARAIAAQARAADGTLVALFRTDAVEIARPGLPAAPNGLIGRNRDWGAMFAARFQLGTGAALRVALASSQLSDAARAFTGIEVALSTMEPSGRLPASVPASVSMGNTISDIDIASGAAFFLGDACLGLLSLESDPRRDAVVAPSLRDSLRARVVRAGRWLGTQRALLVAGDARAPNRLLFDARAYLACGALGNDAALATLAEPFVAAAVAAVSADGWFREGDGWDTSYQAVAVDIGMDVASVLPVGSSRDTLLATLERGARWLSARVTADGRVNSSGNRRTCAGGESFLGEVKVLALPSVVIALEKVVAVRRPGDAAALASSAQRVATWARSNPGVSSCFEFG
jgi:hypothetical protein